MLFTSFMVVTLIASFSLVIWRLPLLRSRNELDSWISREAAFLANNWVLLFSAFFVLFVTMFPTLSEAIKGERLTVAAPFYNKWMTPVGLVLLFLTGVGPLLAWRKSSLANLRDSFLWPTLSAVVTVSVTRALGVPIWASGLCFALCAFVTVTILQEFVRGARVRREATGTDLFTALIGLFARSRRRYGGYVIHLGIVLAFLGFAGNGFQREQEVTLQPGQQTDVKPYTVRYDKLSVTDDGQKQMVTAHMTVLRDGQPFDQMFPARWFFRDHEQEPTTEVALRRTIVEDLYLVLAGYDPSTRVRPVQDHHQSAGELDLARRGRDPDRHDYRAPARAHVRVRDVEGARGRRDDDPCSSSRSCWAARRLPERNTTSRRSRSSRPPSRRSRRICATRSSACAAIAAASGWANVCARSPPPSATRSRRSSKAARRATKSFSISWRSTAARKPLAEPIDKGFNRLAWFFPYAAGLVGIAVVGGVAFRWSRRAHQPETPAPLQAAASTALQQQLDDELRDLD